MGLAQEARKRKVDQAPGVQQMMVITGSLILAGVALAALLAAASPPLIKRLRSRFPRARPAPQADRP